MKKTLIVSPAWVGDMIMAQCLFKLIKQREPDTQIDILAPRSTAALAKRMPEITEVFTLPLGHGDFSFNARRRLGLQLREQQYDHAIVTTNSWKSALTPFFANIPLRTGWRGEWRYGLLNDVRQLDKTRYPLMIERFMALGLPANATLEKPYVYPALHVKPDDVDKALEKVQIKQPTQPVLALCPGAAFGPAKRWPTAHFAKVAQEKIAEGWQIWIFGSPNEKNLAADIQALTQNRCVDLCGRTNLVEAIDLLSLANAVVSNDSGLMHIAAALKKRLVVLYGSSSPIFTPPLADPSKMSILSMGLDCSPCFKRTCPLGHLKCLQDLLPAKVLEALSQLQKA